MNQNWEAYVDNNPDLLQAYNSNVDMGGLRGASSGNKAAWGQRHYMEFGRFEGRDVPTIDTTTNPDGSTNMPIEQGLLETALPQLTADIEGDAKRSAQIDELQKQLGIDYEQARKLYDNIMSGDRLKEEYAMADETGRRLGESATTAANKQLADLQAMIATLQTNLTGELATRAAGLQKLITELTANLDTYSAEQRKAIAEQIAAEGENLTKSIDLRRTALDGEIKALGTALDAAGVAKRTALQTELASLNAAQQPLNEARLQAADSLVTAVNLGLERTKDQLTAEQAAQGYAGRSSMDDAALARATIEARQQGAGIVGQTKVTNAEDVANIAKYGATQGRTLEDALAEARLGLDTRAATEGRSLSDIFAQEQRQIGDTGAIDLRNLAGDVGTRRLGIGATGAQTGYENTLYGAGQRRTIGDTGATGAFQIQGDWAKALRDAADTATRGKAGYFDADYERRLNAALQAPNLTYNLGTQSANLDVLRNAGLNRTLQTLNWWGGGSGMPQIAYNTVPTNTEGTDISALGSALLGAGLKWWQKPATTAK